MNLRSAASTLADLRDTDPVLKLGATHLQPFRGRLGNVLLRSCPARIGLREWIVDYRSDRNINPLSGPPGSPGGERSIGGLKARKLPLPISILGPMARSHAHDQNRALQMRDSTMERKNIPRLTFLFILAGTLFGLFLFPAFG